MYSQSPYTMIYRKVIQKIYGKITFCIHPYFVRIRENMVQKNRIRGGFMKGFLFIFLFICFLVLLLFFLKKALTQFILLVIFTFDRIQDYSLQIILPKYSILIILIIVLLKCCNIFNYTLLYKQYKINYISLFQLYQISIIIHQIFISIVFFNASIYIIAKKVQRIYTINFCIAQVIQCGK